VVLDRNVTEGILEGHGGIVASQVVAPARCAAYAGLEGWRLRKLGQLHLKGLLGHDHLPCPGL
jgi:hypothetical protein